MLTKVYSRIIKVAFSIALLSLIGGSAYAVPVLTEVFELGGPTTPGGAGELIYDPDVSSADLLDGIVGVETGGWGAPAARLNDGVHGGSFDQGAGVTGIAWPTVGASVTFALGSGSGFGYDITEVQSIAAWQSAGFGNQGYTLEVQPLGGAFELLYTVDYTPIPADLDINGAGATKVNVVDDGTGPGGILATGIEAIRFTQTDLGAASAGGRATYRELDIFGMETAPSAPLTLEVNRGSGAFTIKNTGNSDITNVNSYEILSEADSLSTAWTGLGAQSGFPLGDGSGNGWEKADQSSPGALAELYGFGSSDFTSGSSVGIGAGYNTVVDAQDLAFRYTTTDSTMPIVGLVTYIVPDGIEGDYNGDSIVDLADYTVWRNNLGAAAGTLPNDTTGQVIGTAQYNNWKANYGATATFVGGSSATVPEPTSLVLIAGIVTLGSISLRKQTS